MELWHLVLQQQIDLEHKSDKHYLYHEEHSPRRPLRQFIAYLVRRFAKKELEPGARRSQSLN